MNTTDQNYIVNLNTDQVAVVAGCSYRIHVKVGPTELGFADIQLFLNQREAKNIGDNTTIALIDGKTLPIKFWLGCNAGGDCGEGRVGRDGGTVVSLDQLAGVFIPAGALDGDVTIRIRAVGTRPCLPSLRIPAFDGCYEFTTDPPLSEVQSNEGGVFNTNVTVGICVELGEFPIERARFLHLYQQDPDQFPMQLPNASAAFLPCDPGFGEFGGTRFRLFDFATRGLAPLLGPLALLGMPPQTLHASTSMIHFGVGGSTDEFSLFTWGLPTEMNKNAGDGQLAAAGTAVAIPPSVIFKDSTGSLVEGVPVTFSVGSSGGSVTGASTTSGADGVATVGSWTLGTAPGAYTLIASAPAGSGVFNSPQTFTAHVPVAWSLVAAGNQHTCAITAASAAFCWGRNAFGQLGNGTTTPSLTPVAVTGGLTFQSISGFGGDLGAGDQAHTCAATTGNAGYCWGAGAVNVLGNGSTANQSSPTAVAGTAAFASTSVNTFESCGVTTAGAAYCWGLGANGRLGNGDVVDQSTPAAVFGGLVFRSISTGGDHVCGVTTSDDAYCWGNNRQGQLGRGAAAGGGPATLQDSVPILVAGGLKWLVVSAGNTHSCGVATGNVAYCWGNNDNSRLGAATTETCAGLSTGTTVPCSTSPIAVSGGLSFGAVSAGTFHTCGLTTAGSARCWGNNTFGGQLGDGSSVTNSATPVTVAGGHVFTSISAGSFHTCAVRNDQAIFCWGSNSGGQLGNNTTVNSSTPVRVSEP